MLKVDDQFPSHIKVVSLSHRAFRLHVTGLCYCAANLTDGLITREALPIVGAIAGRGRALTDELEDARLWVPTPAGWAIHDYLDWNPTKEHIQEKRQIGKENAERRWRGKPNANGNANGIADGNATPNACLTQPLPLGALAPSPAVDVGHDAHASKIAQVAFACRAQGEDIAKIERAARGCAEGDLVWALEACSGPGVRDRLAVALAELKKRRAA